jgi:hypothetical protein
MHRAFWAAFCFLLAACQIDTNNGGNSGPTRGLPAGFGVGSNSATQPVVQGSEIIFKVNQGDCSSRNYGDGRGENDCANMNTKSEIATGGRWRLGETYKYEFDFWIDPTLTHRGHETSNAIYTNNFNSRLEIARWQGEGYVKNHLYDVEADTTRGVTFLGRTCVPPSQFGSWHRFEMRIRWANDETGYIEVKCDGRTVYADTKVATNQAPHCFLENHCEPGVFKDPDRFNMQLGILFDKEVVNGQPMFPRIPPNGLTIKMRNIQVSRV